MPKDSFTPRKQDALVLRKPESTDGAAIWELVRACKPLDENSMYCNIVQAEHFRDTCVVAELDGELEAQLDPARFIRVHRSALVNLDFVDSMKADDQSQLIIQMRDGTTLTASREASKVLREMAI